MFLVLVAVLFEEDGLGRLGFSDLSLKDEHLSIRAVYEGSSVFGKSLCYKILPFVMEHHYNQLDASKSCIVLVVSPLMVDQSDRIICSTSKHHCAS